MGVSMLPPVPVPVLAVCGYSGSGKTTLLTQVIPKLGEQGLEVGVIKTMPTGYRLAQALLSQAQGLAYLGSGALPGDAVPAPQLPDPPDPGGPSASMVAAMRWQPFARWLVVPVDAVALRKPLLHWWLQRFVPGRWAVVLQDPQGQPIPVFAAMAPQLCPYLETAWLAGQGPRALLRHPKSLILPVPTSLARELSTVNTWQEWEKAQQETQEE